MEAILVDVRQRGVLSPLPHRGRLAAESIGGRDDVDELSTCGYMDDYGRWMLLYRLT